jgi:predicted RNA binding protein YcfA (HicA-like mRNA interferase family)
MSLPRAPVVSGKDLIKFLKGLGYVVIRQKGSHVRLRRKNHLGEHNITVPEHDEIAKGTLNDIISKVSLWVNIPREELMERLREE